MTDIALQELINTLKRSSKFSAGDAGCFKIIFNKSLELPGKYSAFEYLKDLKINNPKRTLVLFAGSGGLCVELCKVTQDVVAYEPRLQYNGALKEVCKIAQLATGAFILRDSMWPTGEFDTILWSEGFDQLKNPMITLSSVYDLLAEGGDLFVEITHGEQISTGGNSWKPTEKVFLDTFKKQIPEAVVSNQKGRLQRRTIYKITKPSVIRQEEKLPESTEFVILAAKEVDFKEVSLQWQKDKGQDSLPELPLDIKVEKIDFKEVSQKIAELKKNNWEAVAEELGIPQEVEQTSKKIEYKLTGMAEVTVIRGEDSKAETIKEQEIEIVDNSSENISKVQNTPIEEEIKKRNRSQK